MDNHIAIIGGAGFVGSSLARRLDNSQSSYIIGDINLHNHKNNIVYLDVRDLDTFHNVNDCSIIINLAAEHRDDVMPLSRYDDVNVKGAVNVCNFARKNDTKKIIFTSSVAIYGFAPAGTSESGEPNYFNDYGRTKYLAEQVYKKWHSEAPDDRTLVIIRPTVIFGEGNRGNVFNLLKQIADKRFIMFGNGNNKKSMAYVENVSAFLEYTLAFEPGLHIYNYIDKPDFDINTLVSVARETLFNKNNVGLRLPGSIGISIGYLADIAAKIIDKKLPVSSIRVKKFMSTTQFSSSVSNTGFIAPVSLKEGLARTLRYEFLEDNSMNRTYDTE